MIADYLGLSPSTVSFVLNDVPGRSIPDATRERVRDAARRFHYQPSLIARKLQGQRINTIGIVLPELGEGYHSQVISGAGDLFMRLGFFYFTVHHRHRPELLKAYPELLEARGVEGILAIDTHLERETSLPTVLVAGHTDLKHVSNVVLNSWHGADLALGHLHQLGHREIVYMRGQLFSTDTEARWAATLEVARKLGLEVREELVIRLEQDSHSPEIGYPGIRKLVTEGPAIQRCCVLQRCCGDGHNPRLARLRASGSGRRLGDRLRRHPVRLVPCAESHDRSTAAAEDGRDCGADAAP